MPHDRILKVCQITGRGDRAFDRESPLLADALKAYAKTRTETDRAKIPLLPGKTLTLYGVKILTPDARAFVRDTEGVTSRMLAACRVGVVSIEGPHGSEAPVTESRGDVGQVATKAWTERLAALGGGTLLDELGVVVLTRAEVGDPDEGDGDPLGPYGLLSGARLAL